MATKKEEALAAHLFRIVWQILSYVDQVDAWGGTEQLRVKREWLEAGCPLPVAPFIVQHANAAAGGVQ